MCRRRYGISTCASKTTCASPNRAAKSSPRPPRKPLQTSKPSLDTDVLVAGGGPVGLFLAVALERAPLRVTLVSEPSAAPDRPIALAHGSRLLLDRLDAFKGLPATPI